jgi:hypothetical protein
MDAVLPALPATSSAGICTGYFYFGVRRPLARTVKPSSGDGASPKLPTVAGGGRRRTPDSGGHWERGWGGRRGATYTAAGGRGSMGRQEAEDVEVVPAADVQQAVILVRPSEGHKA